MIKATIDNLSDEIKTYILQRLHETKEWKTLQSNFDKARAICHATKMQKYHSIMRQAEQNALQYYVDSLETETVSLKECIAETEDADREKTLNCVYGIAFASDMIDSYIIECNSHLRKYHPDTEVNYERLVALKEEVKKLLHNVYGNSTEENQHLFADYSDKVFTYADKQKRHSERHKNLKSHANERLLLPLNVRKNPNNSITIQILV